ncbi:MAG: hypothetical protein SGILL_006672, partial [Bacillariaceae sp.]
MSPCRELLALWSPGHASLALAAVSHTFLLFHCYPYLGYMCVELVHNQGEPPLTVDSAGWYAGLLGSAFNAGRYSYVTALIARFCMGLSNSLSGCVKRISMDQAAKAAKEEWEDHHTTRRRPDAKGKDDKEELDTFKQRKEEMVPAAVLSVMMWGSAFGPCIGGLLSNPGAYSEDTFMPDPVEQTFPFLLPNLVGALLCLISMVGVVLFIPGEPTEMRPTDTLRALPATRASKTPSTLEERQTLLPSASEKKEKKDNRDAIRLQLFKSALFRMHFIAYTSFSFVVVLIDEALPLFCIARLSGPGFSPMEIGLILSTAGFLTSISQALSLKDILIWHDRDAVSGYYPGLRVASILSNVPSVLIPLVLVINGGTYYQVTISPNLVDDDDDALTTAEEETYEAIPGRMNAWSFAFLVVLTALTHKFSSTYFSMIGIATSRIVPHSHREEAARVMTQGALAARSISPVVAGVIVSLFMAPPGSMVDAFQLWAVIGLAFGFIAAAFTFQLDPGRDSITRERSERRQKYLNNIQRARMHLRLWEIHYDQGSDTVASKWRRLARKAIVYNRLTGSPKMEKQDSQASGGSSIVLHDDDKTPSHHKIKSKRTSWVDHMFRPGLDLEEAGFLILGTHKNDKACAPHVLTPPLMEALQKHLPYSFSDQNFWLRFSLSRDGDSFAALQMKISMAKNTIIVIETLKGDVFGCFMTNRWRKTGRYEMCGESFLWRMKRQRQEPGVVVDGVLPKDEDALNEIAKREGDIEVYPWTGDDDN